MTLTISAPGSRTMLNTVDVFQYVSVKFVESGLCEALEVFFKGLEINYSSSKSEFEGCGGFVRKGQ